MCCTCDIIALLNAYFVALLICFVYFLGRANKVGSALERFLHADEVLKLWRQEEELEDQMEDGEDVSEVYEPSDFFLFFFLFAGCYFPRYNTLRSIY